MQLLYILYNNIHFLLFCYIINRYRLFIKLIAIFQEVFYIIYHTKTKNY